MLAAHERELWTEPAGSRQLLRDIMDLHTTIPTTQVFQPRPLIAKDAETYRTMRLSEAQVLALRREGNGPPQTR